MERLRIAFATPEYVTEEYFDGGLANYLHRLAKALADMGHDVHVVTLSEVDESEFEHEGVRVHRIMAGKWCSQFQRLTRYRLPTAISLLDLSVRIYRRLKQLNAEQPLQLAQFSNYSCCGLVSMCFLNVPHVLRASSYQPAWNDALGIKRSLDSRIVGRLEGLQFRLSRHVYAPSHNLQQMLMKKAGLPDVRVIRSPFYVETRDDDSSVHDQFLQGKKYLLFFGRLQLHKGVHTLAQALPRFLDRYQDAYVALVGRDMESSLAPSMADYVRARCGRFADRLVVLDRLPHRQLYPVIAGAHLVVLPSLIENFPNACLEAMGLGKVVIGTVGTSFEELISDGATGFLVSPDNPEALADKLISAWIDPQLDAMGAAARETTLQFAPEKTVEQLLTYYRDILRSRGRASAERVIADRLSGNESVSNDVS